MNDHETMEELALKCTVGDEQTFEALDADTQRAVLRATAARFDKEIEYRIEEARDTAKSEETERAQTKYAKVRQRVIADAGRLLGDALEARMPEQLDEEPD